MPELRNDPISGRWVIIATERAARPTDFAHEPMEINDESRCPFCPGREGMTPPELFAIRAPGSVPNTPGWQVRVVSNKYPALRIEGNTARTEVGMFTRTDGVGAHEVIIETPDHHTHLGLLLASHVKAVVAAYLQRYRDLDNDPRFEYGLLFRNHGRTAGASLSHPHSQLIALPVIPKRAAEEVEAAERYFGRHAACIFCRMIEQELASRERVVFENDRFVAVQAYAARFPFETWLLPKEHAASFGDLTDADMMAFAEALRAALLCLHTCLANPPYNFIVHTAPYHYQPRHAYHWHLEIMPRLTQVAGFEWGSGFFINPVVPEEAARFLREAAAAVPNASGVEVLVSGGEQE
ncbi:MAG: galactose-1-phosphate uridylyltransferase [Armatimonadota bacterium]|nr:galactose-1-phosphate uridylyltransferase [Armatimonadota bacterium]MDR7548615.1 galactose-1-phosphate uridylyltransferase [Armatimonadota bacterium]